jgi:hypothetical protein
VTLGVTLHLKVLSKFEPRVDHAANTKSYKTYNVFV